MNIPKTIETALAELIRNEQIGSNTMIRCWHVLENDTRWRSDEDRKMPCVDVRCAPPGPGDQASTMVAQVAIECAAMAEDDRNHAVISQIEEGVQTALDKFFSHCRKRTGASLTRFKTEFDKDCAPAVFGYMTFSGATPPYDDGGINVVALSISIHYTRADFNQ